MGIPHGIPGTADVQYTGGRHVARVTQTQAVLR
jgi:hypothetical protein